MGFFSAYNYLYILYTCLLPKEVRRGIRSKELEVQTVVSTMWALGIELGPSRKAAVLSTTEPSLQATACIFNRPSANSAGVKSEEGQSWKEHTSFEATPATQVEISQRPGSRRCCLWEVARSGVLAGFERILDMNVRDCNDKDVTELSLKRGKQE